jgi:Na+/melibiose symporter-like transporter
VLSFIRKTGQGIGGAVAACIIGLGGYIATAKTQAGSALTSIRVAAGIIPATLFLAAAAVMLVYPLTEKAFRAIVAEMAERRAAAADGAIIGACLLVAAVVVCVHRPVPVRLWLTSHQLMPMLRMW